MRSPEKIAVFRALRLGDLLLAVPALRSLRRGFPEAEITLIGLPWAEVFVARFSRHLDRFVEFGGYRGITEVPLDAGRSARFIADQRAFGYDLVIQMHGSGRTSNSCVIAMAGRATAGYFEGNRPAGLTVAAPYPDDQPEVLRNLELVKLLGCSDSDPILEFPRSAADETEADRLLASVSIRSRRLIGLHPGANAPARRWPSQRFAEVVDRLGHSYDAAIVLTGGPHERTTAEDVARMAHVPVLNLAGHTSLGGLAAIIARLELFISNDTGPAHLAEALGTPSVTIFGPADVRRWAPLDRRRHQIVRHPVSCSPCPHRVCPIDHRCLTGITPDDVIEAAEMVLSRTASEAAA